MALSETLNTERERALAGLIDDYRHNAPLFFIDEAKCADIRNELRFTHQDPRHAFISLAHRENASYITDLAIQLLVLQKEKPLEGFERTEFLSTPYSTIITLYTAVLSDYVGVQAESDRGMPFSPAAQEKKFALEQFRDGLKAILPKAR
jgi:hypothetical protein